MEESSSERQLAETRFGSVSDRRVIYYAKKGWFRGGSRQDVPLKHVTSVRVDIKRKPILGVILLLAGLAAFSSVGSSDAVAGAVVLGVLGAGIGFLLVWGWPSVLVNTAGTDLTASIGWPWDRSAAEQFAEALRTQLFRDEAA